MKLKAITCDALARPVYWCAAQSPHIVDVELLRFGLHSQPNDLRAMLQARIEAAAEGYDAIVLAYGLCGKATAGLKAVGTPLVLPRAHDCITLFLGSRARYTDQFENKPGTYWYVQDYIERGEGSNTTLSIGAGMESNVQDTYKEYVQKYGEDNAAYLMEVMGAWQQHYQRAAFIDMGIGNGAAVAAKAQDEATRRGWAFERLAGDLTLIRRLLWGEWDADFLILQPGQAIEMSYDESVVQGI
jgi:hypothetical protein